MFFGRLSKAWRVVACALCGILAASSFRLCTVAHDFPLVDEAYALLDGYGAEPAVLAFAFAYALYRLVSKPCVELADARTKAMLAIAAFVFGVLNVCGCNMAYLDSLMVFHETFWILVFLVCVIGYALLFFVGASWALVLMARLCVRNAIPQPAALKAYFLCAAAILLCWLPWLISYYPATADFDSMRQICTVLGILPLSNHDPILSSVVIGSVFKLGSSIAGDNFGLFLFVLLRAIVMALIYAYCIATLRRLGVDKAACLLVTLFYALVPVWGAYAKQPFKDTFSAALFCLFAVRTVLLVAHMRKREAHLWSYVLFAVAGLLVSLFRHNYFYVFVFAAIVVSVVLIRRKAPAPGILVLVASVVFYVLLNAFVVNVLGAAPGRPAEALAIPLQQTARTVRDHGADMLEEERDGIQRLLDFDALGEAYDPVISDPVKNTIPNTVTTQDYLAYLCSWFAQGPRYAKSYVEAFFAGTYGYYAFVGDGYPSGGARNCGMVILSNINKTNMTFNEAFDFSYVEGLRDSRMFLEAYSYWWHRTPVLSLTDTIPAYTWLIVVVWLYVGMRRKGLWGVVPAMLLVAVLTCVASPVNGSFRYFVPIAAATPTLLAVVVQATGCSSDGPREEGNAT
ncbi:MAG: hypothetical protein IKF78_06850 [Atopobiaceae bacterium]|nr:hypothetical protein [Atopobiaceae bacterium]